MTARIHRCFLGCQSAEAHHFVGHRVVIGDLPNGPLTNEIDTRVTDVNVGESDAIFMGDEGGGDQGGAHAPAIRVLGNIVEDGHIGGSHRIGEFI